VGYRAQMVGPGRQAACIGFLIVAWALFFSSAGISTASAERQHTVRNGQSLARIAKQYRVDVTLLAAANGLSSDDSVKNGQVLTVPEQGAVYVVAGQTLVGIARANKVGVAALASANGIKPDSPLRIGQRLILPGHKPSKAEKRWGVPKTRGTVSFHRLWSRETIRVRVVDTRGAVRKGAVRQLREFLRPRESKKRKLPNERLLRLLSQVSDHFGGRPLHVVSGYRLPGGNTNDSSRHVAGEAVDFRIPGVPLEELRDFCQKFQSVGVGFYPRSHFVHLDVRRQNARWTDWSMPGQRAVLTKPDDVDTQGNPIPAEPILPASDRDLQDAPPAPDDGQPPLDDPLPPRPMMERRVPTGSTASARSRG
jgi:uncharacterized protein YcbK (DUF882 family)